MSTSEQSPELKPRSDFSLELFDTGGLDINAAFQDAMHEVATDAELALDEKVRRMEVIVSEGTSEVYRDFVDFQHMANQMELYCAHDELLGQATQESGMLSGFMGTHASSDAHDHHHDGQQHEEKVKKDEEIDPVTGKKKKKRRGWLGFAFDL